MVWLEISRKGVAASSPLCAYYTLVQKMFVASLYLKFSLNKIIDFYSKKALGNEFLEDEKICF